MIQFLVREGANVHYAAAYRDTVLHLAIDYVEETCLELVKISIEAGCNPAARNSDGKTILEAAIERGYISVVQLLLSHNVPFPPDILLITLLHSSPLQMVQSLIRRGADIHSTAFNGDTLLHLAVANYIEGMCWDLVKIFIQAGCNPTTRNSLGKTILDTAIEREYTSVVELLLLYNVPFPPNVLLVALQKHSVYWVVDFLVRKGAHVHSTTSDGETVLHLAIALYVEAACYYLVKTFIEADCNPAARNSEGKTALEAAVERGYTSVAELLLPCNTPVHPSILLIALRRRCTPQMIRLLVHKGANDLASMSGSDWDVLLQFVHASYSTEDCQQIIGILNTSRKATGTFSNLSDEVSVRVAKRWRFE